MFLLALATAKRIGELQALSFSVSYRGDDLVFHYGPFFLAKIEAVSHPLPQISYSPVSDGLRGRPTRTDSLPSSSYSLSQKGCSLC